MSMGQKDGRAKKDERSKIGVRISDFNGGDDKTLPIPATFVVDQQGRIAWVNADFDYARGSEPLEVLAAVKELS